MLRSLPALIAPAFATDDAIATGWDPHIIALIVPSRIVSSHRQAGTGWPVLANPIPYCPDRVVRPMGCQKCNWRRWTARQEFSSIPGTEGDRGNSL